MPDPGPKHAFGLDTLFSAPAEINLLAAVFGYSDCSRSATVPRG